MKLKIFLRYNTPIGFEPCISGRISNVINLSKKDKSTFKDLLTEVDQAYEKNVKIDIEYEIKNRETSEDKALLEGLLLNKVRRETNILKIYFGSANLHNVKYCNPWDVQNI